jgi:cobalt transport protein
MRPDRRLRNAALPVLVALAPVCGAALYYLAGGAARTGADEQARQAVRDLHAYRPWFEPIWTPPGPAVEALLFLAQAAAGAALLVFAVVRLRARRKP